MRELDQSTSDREEQLEVVAAALGGYRWRREKQNVDKTHDVNTKREESDEATKRVRMYFGMTKSDYLQEIIKSDKCTNETLNLEKL